MFSDWQKKVKPFFSTIMVKTVGCKVPFFFEQSVITLVDRVDKFQKYCDLVVLLFRAEVLVFPLCDQEINSMSDGPYFILDFYYFILVF